MQYREPLPAGCPPDEAEEINSPRCMYRLIANAQPTEDDFKSQRAMKKQRQSSGISECLARGLSIFPTIDASKKVLMLPNFRGYKICRLCLDDGAGKIQQTGLRGHHTWWPLATYDILACCEVEDT